MNPSLGMADEGATQSTLRTWLIIGGGLGLLGLAAAGITWNMHPEGSLNDSPWDESQPPASASASQNNPIDDPPAPPERTAILGGLKVGSTISGWRVAALTISSKPEVKGSLAVLCKKGPKAFAVWIAPKGQLRMPAPNETEKHAIYSGFFVDTEWLEAATPIEEIVERVRSSEGLENGAPSPSATAPAP